jgi:hypothetical protein
MPDTQYRIKIHLQRDRYTGAETQRWIYRGRNSGGYTAADTAVDIQHSRHSG